MTSIRLSCCPPRVSNARLVTEYPPSVGGLKFTLQLVVPVATTTLLPSANSVPVQVLLSDFLRMRTRTSRIVAPMFEVLAVPRRPGHVDALNTVPPRLAE